MVLFQLRKLRPRELSYLSNVTQHLSGSQPGPSWPICVDFLSGFLRDLLLCAWAPLPREM